MKSPKAISITFARDPRGCPCCCCLEHPGDFLTDLHRGGLVLTRYAISTGAFVMVSTLFRVLVTLDSCLHAPF